jgi:hypothetical protein
MRRTHTQPGARFAVRGQRYVQVGSFLYDMDSGHTVRILELKTDCPECGASFELTASLGQIEKRMLVRRCERCRKIHRGPVDVRKLESKAMKAAKSRVRRRRTRIPGESISTRIAALPAGAVSGAAPAPVSREEYETDLDTYRMALGMLA